MPTVAIIGGGFCGTMVAVHLLRAGAGLRVLLIERTGRFGRGAAYGTSSPSHLLNVPAGRMSPFENDPEHFLRWVRSRLPGAGGGDFVPRMIYGEYLDF